MFCIALISSFYQFSAGPFTHSIQGITPITEITQRDWGSFYSETCL